MAGGGSSGGSLVSWSPEVAWSPAEAPGSGLVASFQGEELPLLPLIAQLYRLLNFSSELALLQPVNVERELECRPQFQAHVLHHHVTAQQEQGLAIDLLWVGEEGQK